MAWTIADGLGWLPIFPDRPPHRVVRLLGGMVEPFASVTIPVPVVPGLLAFLPSFPDQVPHHRVPIARSDRVAPFEAAIAPLAWLPTYPNQVPHRRLARANYPPGVSPPPGELIAIAQRMAWSPRFPDQVPHHRPPDPSSGVLPLTPEVAAAGEPCVDLIDGVFSVPGLLTEGLTQSGFITEALGSPTLRTEDLC